MAFGKDLRIAKKGLLLIAVPLIFQIVCVITLATLHQQAEQYATNEARKKEMIIKLETMQRIFFDAMASVSMRLMTKTAEFDDRFEEDILNAHNCIKGLKKDIVNDDELDSDLLLLTKMLDRETAVIRKYRDQYLDFGFVIEGQSGWRELRSNLQKTLIDIPEAARRLSEAIARKGEEDALRAAAARKGFQWLVFFAVVINILICILLTRFFGRDISDRIGVVLANFGRLLNRDHLIDPIGGKDEIGELDRSFHLMADKLLEAARKERAMIDNAADAICILDKELTFNEVGDGAKRVLGCKPEHLKSTALLSIVETNDRKRLQEFFQRLKEPDSPIQSHECRATISDGSLKWVEVSACWVPSEQRYFCVLHDIADRKRLEQAKLDFTNMMSHDLRTPLTSLLTVTDLLQSGVLGTLNEKGNRTIVTAQSSLWRLVSMVNELLDVEKISNCLALNLRDVSLWDLASDSIGNVAIYAESCQVTIELTGDCFVKLSCDPNYISRTIQNLLSNAIKYSPSGSAVHVDVNRDGQGAIVRVSDKGPGVPPEHRETIFDRFGQIDLPEYQRKNSTGLGLAFCKQAVEAHGGTIGVESPAGEGSTFWFSLPGAVQGNER